MTTGGVVVTIKRIAMRGGDNKVEIKVGDSVITIQPNSAECYDLIRLLSGGPRESVQLAAEQG